MRIIFVLPLTLLSILFSIDPSYSNTDQFLIKQMTLELEIENSIETTQTQLSDASEDDKIRLQRRLAALKAWQEQVEIAKDLDSLMIIREEFHKMMRDLQHPKDESDDEQATGNQIDAQNKSKVNKDKPAAATKPTRSNAQQLHQQNLLNK